MISPVDLEPFLPLKWACDKPLCEISSTGLVFLVPRDGRLQSKAQKNAVWKFDLDGLGWGHCRAMGWTVEIPFGGAHTPARSLDPSSASSSVSLPLLCFCKANHISFWLEEDNQLCTLCSGCEVQDKINKQPREGVVLWNTLVLWSSATADYFTFISNNLYFGFMPLCAGASICMLWHIGHINHWIQSISQWHYPENELCSQCEQEHQLHVCVSKTAERSKPIDCYLSIALDLADFSLHVWLCT